MSELSFYMHDGPAAFRFELAGNLAGEEVRKLDQAWRTASSTFSDKVLAVDITFLKAADEQGRDLLKRWSNVGAHLIANSEISRALAESVTGCNYETLPHSAVGPTFNPRFTTSAFRSAVAALILSALLLFPTTASAEENIPVLERYSAGLADRGLDTATVTLEIEASVPKLQRNARVEAIRRWTDGKREYQFVAIEGDRAVRNEMIARYFAIDTEKAPLAAPITESNYKFKLITNDGAVSVFQITPRKKRKGMIAGEMWIDNETGLMTHLSGRLVKNPSVMLRHVGISQEMEIRHGAAFARETRLEVETRFIGRAELTIRERARAADGEVAKGEVAKNVAP